MNDRELFDIRRDFLKDPLNISDMCISPFEQFDIWFNDAGLVEDSEVNSMVLATVAKDNMPSARVVLLKRFSHNGFVFFTNYDSKKGVQISENNKGSLLFFWQKSMRQIRIEGEIFKTSKEESDDYFYSRPIQSQITATYSKQSYNLPDMDIFRRNLKEKYEHKKPIERPNNWGGYILVPNLFEFWQGGPARLHDRFLYTQEKRDWKISMLYP